MSRSSSPSSVQAQLPECPNGLFNLGRESVLVTDADEEILELYMNLASSSPEIGVRDTDSGGLGFLDSTKSILELSLDLTPSRIELADDVARKGKTVRHRSQVTRSKSVHTVEVKVQQDLTALKGRKGDTGSVLWRSSLHLARLLLSQHHHPPLNPLLDAEKFRQGNVLELGAGTGLLAALLSPICRRYTASDRLENLKLVKRNLELNGLAIEDGAAERHPTARKSKTGKDVESKAAIRLEEIDWVAVAEERKRYPNGHKETDDPYDLVLAVDCIYNEHLVQPLIDTLTYYCPAGVKTVVWVVVELRSADVLTTFVETWLADSGGWTIVRLDQGSMGKWRGKRARWVGWVGWR